MRKTPNMNVIFPGGPSGPPGPPGPGRGRVVEKEGRVLGIRGGVGPHAKVTFTASVFTWFSFLYVSGPGERKAGLGGEGW